MSKHQAPFRPSARKPRVHFRKLAELDARARMDMARHMQARTAVAK